MKISVSFQCTYPHAPDDPQLEVKIVESAGPLGHEEIRSIEQAIAKEKTKKKKAVPRIIIMGCQPIID